MQQLQLYRFQFTLGIAKRLNDWLKLGFPPEWIESLC